MLCNLLKLHIWNSNRTNQNINTARCMRNSTGGRETLKNFFISKTCGNARLCETLGREFSWNFRNFFANPQIQGFPADFQKIFIPAYTSRDSTENEINSFSHEIHLHSSRCTAGYPIRLKILSARRTRPKTLAACTYAVSFHCRWCSLRSWTLALFWSAVTYSWKIRLSFESASALTVGYGSPFG